MGDLIHDRKQKLLPWETHKAVCRRCKGSRTVYYAAMRSGVEVLGGRRIPCPDCGGKGTVLEPERDASGHDAAPSSHTTDSGYRR